MRDPRPALITVALLCTAACDDSPTVVNRFGVEIELRDVRDAPPSLQQAASAVVRLATLRARGTGFFVGTEGLLMTNEHVLGGDDCPREGCYINVAFNFEKGKESEPSKLLFAQPLYANRILDVAVFRLLDPETDTPYPAPHVLRLSTDDARTLSGQTLHVVGHPLGKLKKWSEGRAHVLSGDWIETTNFILSGNSGSPLLTREGAVVGIVHSQALNREQHITPSGINAEAYASTAQALAAATGLTEAGAVNQDVALFPEAAETRIQSVIINGRIDDQPRVAELATAARLECEQEVLGYDGHKSHPIHADSGCYSGLLWLSCDEEEGAASYRVCPDAEQKQAWNTLLHQIHSRDIAIQGQPTALWSYEAVHGDDSDEAKAEATAVVDEYLATLPELNLDRAGLIVRYTDRKEVNGTDLAQMLLGYRDVPGFEYHLPSIRYGLFALYDRERIDGNQLINELVYMFEHDNTSLRDMLTLEAVLHNSGYW